MGDRAERLVNLTIAFLEARAPMTLADLRRKTTWYDQADPEAGRRMFERDKDALRSLGIPLRTVPTTGASGDVGYILDRKEYELPAVDLSVEEMSALGVALGAVTDSSAASGYAKVWAAGPDPGRPPRSPAVAQALPPQADTLSEAIAARRCVAFGYRTASGDESRRTIDPWTLVWRRGRAYVVGRDHDRDAQRAFRLDRISGSVTEVGDADAFTTPEHLDVAAATEVPGAATISATVVVERQHRWLVEREGGIEIDRSERTVTHQLVAPREAVVQLACELGARGRVIEPPQAVAAVVTALERMRDTHVDGAP